MSAFEVNFDSELSASLSVAVNDRFEIVIEATEAGLSLRIYPRTDGEPWESPFAVFEIKEADVLDLEREMEP